MFLLGIAICGSHTLASYLRQEQNAVALRLVEYLENFLLMKFKVLDT